MNKVYDIVEDKFEELEATNEAVLALHIKEDNIELNMEVEMEVVEIDEDDAEVGEEEAH